MAIIPAVGVGVVVTNVVITYNEYFSHFIIQCSPIPDFSASVQEKTGNWVANSDLSEITLLNTIFSGRKGKMYYKGDLTRKWSRSGGMTQKGVNTGDAWHIERGLTGGGKVAAKYFPFGSATGINKEEKWETKKGRADKRV